MAPTERPIDQVDERRRKLTGLRAQRARPYGAAFATDGVLARVASAFAEGRSARAAGRLSAKRGHGGLTFADLRDASGKLQICVKSDRVGEEPYRRFLDLDLGDIVGIEGEFFKTKTGEVTIQVNAWTLLAKSLRPLPEKWHGLKDVAIRYRQRYLDLIANEPVREVFRKRAQLISSLRQTLEREGFIEVETPMMHPIPGGAAGEPFVTHHKVLDADLYLRLAPELYLKKLLVGGYDRVYEINRSFRNDGVSTQHNPEFTMLEAYAAYGDYRTMMRLVQTLICEAAQAVCADLQLEFQGQAIDLTAPWEEVSFAGALADLGLKPGATAEQMQTVLRTRGVKVKDLTRSQLTRLVEQLFEPKTRGKPLFVVDYWTELSPLAKSKPDDPSLAERFELFIGGMEVANAYSELNDPIEQRRRFEAQLEGGRGQETGGKGKRGPPPPAPRPMSPERRIDEDFLTALEHGMPPAGGLGVGVDRLAMLLLNQPSIKDVILFPLLKPEATS
jgi:lysyl-tRNA synthetase class 2